MAWLVALIAALAIAIIVYLIEGRISRKQTVTGELQPTRGVVRVYAPQTATIREKRVEEGQSVAAGEVLFVLSNERASGSSASVEQELRLQLTRQRSSLQSQLQQERSAGGMDVQRLKARAGSLRVEVARLDEDLGRQSQRLRMNTQQIEKQRQLADKGYVARITVEQQEQAHLQLLGEVEALRRSRLGLLRAAEEAEDESRSALLRAGNRADDYGNQLARVEQELAELSLRSETLVRAAIAGRIAAITSEVGQTVTAQNALASILPEGDVLQARLYAPTRAIGFVQPGQSVRLRYEAFPYERFGSASGTVKIVGRSLVLPLDQSSVALQEGSYSITVQIERQNLTAYGEQWPLQAGMRLQADLLLGEQRIVEWIAEPLFALRRKSL